MCRLYFSHVKVVVLPGVFGCSVIQFPRGSPAIACMLISSVSVNAATKNYSQTALSRTAITREPGAQGFVALRNVNGKVKWTSSNTSVVSLVYQTPLYTERPYTGKISEVDFYCKKAGTSKITALYNGKKYICTITVKKGAAVPKFSKNSVTIKRGQSVALKVTGMNSESSYARYSSSNKGYCHGRQRNELRYKR